MLPFLAPVALGLAGKALGGLLHKRRPQGPNEETGMRNRYTAALGAMGDQGNQITSEYLSKMRGFDPRKGWEEATNARLAAQDETFGRTYADRIGSLVGHGRSPYRSGYGVRDAQDTVLQGQRERANIEAQGAGAASDAYGSYLGQLGSFGSDTRNRYLDAVGGRLDTLEAQRLQNAASKRGMWGSLGGGLLSALPEYMKLGRGFGDSVPDFNWG